MQALQFQLIDIHEVDTPRGNYLVHFFGKTDSGLSVHARVSGFHPYFYVPYKFKSNVRNAISEYKIKLERDAKRACHDSGHSRFGNLCDDCKLLIDKRIPTTKSLEAHDFIGFNNYQKKSFIKITCKSKKDINILKWKMGNQVKYYESGILPYLRLLHEQDINPAGWVQVSNYTTRSNTNTDIAIDCHYTRITALDDNSIAPFKITSFDIECYSHDYSRMPDPEHDDDTITQIGTTTMKYGDSNIIRHIVTLDSCEQFDNNTTVISCSTELQLIQEWINYIREIDPDIITGYNIFGFDFKYIWCRAIKLGIHPRALNISRISGHTAELTPLVLSSAAFGYNEMDMISCPGRVSVDLFKVIQRDYKFESYKLDNVAGEFIKGRIKEISVSKGQTKLQLTGAEDLEENGFIGISIDKLFDYELNGDSKFKIKKLSKLENGMFELVIDDSLKLDPSKNLLEWKMKKDDISPKQIFEYQLIDAKHRGIIAKYCIMDNLLCLKLFSKLQILVNGIAMSNICSVPLSFLFLRGQGIKSYSLIAKECRLENYLIPDKIKNLEWDKDTPFKESDTVMYNKRAYTCLETHEPSEITPESDSSRWRLGYQGATVLDAHPGGYFDPIVVNDFSSLYPSSMISHNLSPDTIILEQELISDFPTHSIIVNETETYEFVSVDTSDELIPEEEKPRRGIVPKILIKLLNSRKQARNQLANETDPFKKFVLEGKQLAYKLTANSMYGNLGSSFSATACKPVAASVTAVGRLLIQTAKNIVLQEYPNANVIYGDTDSLMVKYLDMPGDASPETKTDIIRKSIECAKHVESVVKTELPWPHGFCYEKAFYPFLLFGKKKYSGPLYSSNPEKHDYIANKGIVLVRRDNAKIVRTIYHGALNTILDLHSAGAAKNFINQSINDMCNGQVGIDQLVITKGYKRTATELHNNRVFELRKKQKLNDEESKELLSLGKSRSKTRDNNPNGELKAEQPQIALARRLKERGNPVQYNDRIAYIFVQYTPEQTRKKLKELGKKILPQGEIVETIDYAKDNNLAVNYAHYIEKQIMKPLSQLLAIFEEIPKQIKELPEKKITAWQERQVEKDVFMPLIQREIRIQRGIRDISDFFKK